MARTDNDSWEITESVGATALGVAAARAAATESEPADQRPVRAAVPAGRRTGHVGLVRPWKPAHPSSATPPPAAAQELLFERVQALGAQGSRIAVEAPGPDFLDEGARERQRQTMQRVRDLMAEMEPDRDIPDVQDLWYFEERGVGDWLGRHGWDVTVTPAPELMAGYDRRPPQDIDDATPQTLFVSAQRTERN